MALNKAILCGRIVAAPELKKTQSDLSVCSFTIACDRQSRKGEEKVVDFIDIVAWRQTAEFVCQWFGKGDPIIIDGRFQTRTYTDKNGNNRKAFEILAEGVNFAGGKREAQQDQPMSASEPVKSEPSRSVGGFDDFAIDDADLPF